MARNWEPREMRLVAEYLIRAYPEAIHMTRVRLGSLEVSREGGRFAPEELRMLGLFRRWADAIVITPDEMVLIEGKIHPTPGVISQLEIYAELVPHTPELAPYLSLPLRLELVCAIEDPVIRVACEKRGITHVRFSPEWVLEYLKELDARKRWPTQARGLPEE